MTPTPNSAAAPAVDPSDALGRGGRKSAWHFAPCIGTWQGLINPVLVSVPTVLLKSLGFSNAVVGYATLATIPMALKFLLGPMVDAHRTRRWWCIHSGSWLMGCVVVLGLSLMLPTFSIWIYLAALAMLAVVKSIQQIALQGFFTLSLTKSEQALFSGLDPVWGRAATIFTGSILLAVAGAVGERLGGGRAIWAVYYAALLTVFVPLYFYTSRMFPRPAADRPPDPSRHTPAIPFWEVLRGYLALPALLPGLTYLFFMRSGETFLAKMGTAFLMDPRSAGGYGLSITEVGVFTGVMTAFAITGGALSGIALQRYGLRRVVWPFSIAAVAPNLIYVYLALRNQTARSLLELDLSVLGGGIWQLDWQLLIMLGLENFGFGLGFTVMNYYMFRMAAGSRFPASYVAFNASVIYASYMIFGTISGICQEWLGYPGLFILSIVVSLPAFFAIPYMNYALDESKK